MPQYFSDPIQAEFSKKYDILKQDLETRLPGVIRDLARKIAESYSV